MVLRVRTVRIIAVAIAYRALREDESFVIVS